MLRSAQAAGRGAKQKRNSADLAATRESVVREFLNEGLTFAAGRRNLQNRNAVIIENQHHVFGGQQIDDWPRGRVCLKRKLSFTLILPKPQ